MTKRPLGAEGPPWGVGQRGTGVSLGGSPVRDRAGGRVARAASEGGSPPRGTSSFLHFLPWITEKQKGNARFPFWSCTCLPRLPPASLKDPAESVPTPPPRGFLLPLLWAE